MAQRSDSENLFAQSRFTERGARVSMMFASLSFSHAFNSAIFKPAIYDWFLPSVRLALSVLDPCSRTCREAHQRFCGASARERDIGEQQRFCYFRGTSRRSHGKRTFG